MEDRERNRDADRERIRVMRRGRTRMPSFAAPTVSSAVSPMVGATGDVFLEVAARQRERQRARQMEYGREERARDRAERERQRERDERERERERERGVGREDAAVGGEVEAGVDAAASDLVDLSVMFAGADGVNRDERGGVEGREYSYEEMRAGDRMNMGMEAEIEMVEGGGDDVDMDTEVFDGDVVDVGEKPEGALSPAGGVRWAER